MIKIVHLTERVKFGYFDFAFVQVNLVDNDFPKGNCLWEVSIDVSTIMDNWACLHLIGQNQQIQH